MGNEVSRKRPRATAVVTAGKKVLLVRDRGRHRFSLPGGGIERGEPAINAAVREIWEELGLVASKVERVRECDHAGSVNDHRVCLVEVRPDPPPHLRRGELDKFMWWEIGRPSPPVYEHVTAVVEKLRKLGRI